MKKRQNHDIIIERKVGEKMEIISTSTEQTEEIGYKIGQILKKGDIIAYSGDLGAGKTAITRGIAKGLGYEQRVTSPTFAIVNEYICEDFTIFHFDMYRITDADSLYSIGFDDYLNADGIMLIEWSENVIDCLPKGITTIEMKKIDDDTRKIIVGGKHENISI